MADLIDRQELISWLSKDPLFPQVESFGLTGVIESRPSVDAEPVNHRHWVTVRNPMLYQTIPYVKVCSGCLTAFPYEMPYCGECGAKMDEVEE